MKILFFVMLPLLTFSLKATEKKPNPHLEKLFNQGQNALRMVQNPDLDPVTRNKFLNESITAFKNILEQDPNLPQVRLELARAFFIKGHDLPAKKHFTLVLAKNPPPTVVKSINNFLSIIAKRSPTIAAQELLQENRPAEALEELRKLVDIHPENLDVFFLMGKTALDMAHNPGLDEDEINELLNEAILAFAYMLRKDPELPRVHFELARIYFLQGNDLAAKNHFDLILKKDNLPTAVIEDINNFLSIIAKRSPIIAAQELLQEKRPAEALEELRELALTHPDNLDVLFLLGETAFKMAHKIGLTREEQNKFLNEAIATFENMLEKNPELPRVRLELARAYFLKGDDGHAKKHFKDTLEQEPPQQVAQNIEHFLGIMSQRKPWRIRVTASTLYNKNIGDDSGESIIYIYDLPFKLDDDQEEIKSGMGFLIEANGEYQYRLNERYRLRMGGKITHKKWPSHSQFDKTNVSAYAGPHFSINSSNSASVLMVASQKFKKARQILDYTDTGIRIETSHQINERLSANTETYWYDRNYDSSKEENGEGGDLGVNTYYKITPTLQAKLSLGYGYDNPADNKLRKRRNSTELGLIKDFTENFSMEGNIGVKNIEYQGNWHPYTSGRASRKDDVKFFHIKFRYKKYTLLGFKPELKISSEELKSNAQLSDYKKVFGGISFVRKY